jgi:hypothetical protein
MFLAHIHVSFGQTEDEVCSERLESKSELQPVSCQKEVVFFEGLSRLGYIYTTAITTELLHSTYQHAVAPLFAPIEIP